MAKPLEFDKDIDIYSIFPGEWNVGVGIRCKNTHINVEKDTIVYVQTTHNFPDENKILAGKQANGQTVMHAMDEAWLFTWIATTATTQQEYGFNIILVTSPTGSHYECDRISGPVVDYKTRPEVFLPNPWDITHDFLIEYGGKFRVGNFHTHPPLWNQKLEKGEYTSRPVGPSGGDNPNPNGMPCWVYDFVGIKDKETGKMTHYSDGRDDGWQLYNFGGFQRNNSIDIPFN